MRSRPGGFACLLFLAGCCRAQDLPSLSGIWKLSLLKSNLNGLAEPVSATIAIEQTGLTVKCFRYAGGHRAEPECDFSIDGPETHWGDDTRKAVSHATRDNNVIVVLTSVEGSAGEYALKERWTLAGDRNELTIERDTTKQHVATGSVIVYRRSGVAAGAGVPPTTRPLLQPLAPIPPDMTGRAPKTFARRVPDTSAGAYNFTVPAGTVIQLRVMAPIDTKKSSSGQHIGFMVTAPVLAGGHVVIPFGSHVAGTITGLSQAGRASGRSELSIELDSVALPNGLVKPLQSRLESGAIAGEHGGTIDDEGRLRGASRTPKGATHVAEGAAVGAAIGAVISRAGGHEAGIPMSTGIGLGAAAGAGAGLASVLFTRGPSVGLARGATVQMVLNHDVYFTPDDLDRR